MSVAAGMNSVRRAALARARIERARAAGEATTAEPRGATAGPTQEEPAALERIEALLPRRAAAPASAPAREGEGSSTAELLRQRAALELKLQTQTDRLGVLESALASQQNEQRAATETLELQQRRIAELSEERARLLAQAGELDTRLRLAVNAAEQAELKYETLKSSRQVMGQQATEHAERINELQAEVDRLRAELERTRQDRDAAVGAARTEAAQAEAQSADAVLHELWNRMQREIPEVFVGTHVPTRRTFENAADAMIDLVRAFSVLEHHVHGLLRELRQVASANDPITHFFRILTGSPKLHETLRDFLVSGRKGNFSGRLRAHHAWAMSLATGLHKVIIRSPTIIKEQLNYRQWLAALPPTWTLSEDARIGKYYKETAMKELPEKLGTLFRKAAAEMVHEDYNDFMRTK